MRIVWDMEKAEQNFKRHGVSFEEGATVLASPTAISFPDPDHSHSEERFIVVGFSATGRVLFVCYCYRHEAEIRLISARKATKIERDEYEKRI